MATFTSSELTSQVRELHAGLQSKSSSLTVAVTGTASSVVYLAKIPDQATIVDFIWHVVDAGANNTWKLGLQLPEGSASTTVTESALLAETASTAGVTMRPAGLKLPYKVSISDTCVQRWAWIQGVCTAAISASADQRFSVIYTMDGS